MSKRPIFFILIAAALLTPVFAQKPAKSLRPLAPAPITADDLAAADNDPRLAEQRARFDAEMNRELFQIRESVEREALGRMNQRRYDQRPNYERVTDQTIAFSVF